MRGGYVVFFGGGRELPLMGWRGVVITETRDETDGMRRSGGTFGELLSKKKKMKKKKLLILAHLIY